MAHLELKSVRKLFGRLEVIPDLSLTVADGEFCVLVGPSGCGKSTLLRIIAGLETVTSGTVMIDGHDVTELEPLERGIAMVFQSYALYPHMSVAGNIGFGLRMAGLKKGVVHGRVKNAAASLGLETLLERRPRELSGGQRQRVAIGRAITRDPTLFLLDEPLSNLDAALRIGMRFELAKLKARLNATMIYVTHDQVEAMTLADRIMVMNTGRIEQVGTPLELYHQPANRFVAGFIGSPAMDFFDATVTGIDGNVATVRLDVGATLPLTLREPAAAGTRVVLGIRPEHFIYGPRDGLPHIDGVAVFVELLGSDTLLHVKIGDTNFVARIDGMSVVRANSAVALSLPLDQCHVFDMAGRCISELHRIPGNDAIVAQERRTSNS
jgi:multiple sugar transport system ATP-binding protein